MAIQKKEVEFAKEIDDCLVLAVELVKDIKAGKPVAEIASHALPNLIGAINGIDGAKAELEANKAVVMSTVGSRMGELAGALLA